MPLILTLTAENFTLIHRQYQIFMANGMETTTIRRKWTKSAGRVFALLGTWPADFDVQRQNNG
jgi:hypothetical protein